MMKPNYFDSNSLKVLIEHNEPEKLLERNTVDPNNIDKNTSVKIYSCSRPDLMYTIRNKREGMKFKWPSPIDVIGFERLAEEYIGPEELEYISAVTSSETGKRQFESFEEFNPEKSNGVLSKLRRKPVRENDILLLSYSINRESDLKDRNICKKLEWESRGDYKYLEPNEISLYVPGNQKVDLGELEELYDKTVLEQRHSPELSSAIPYNLLDIMKAADLYSSENDRVIIPGEPK